MCKIIIVLLELRAPNKIGSVGMSALTLMYLFSTNVPRFLTPINKRLEIGLTQNALTCVQFLGHLCVAYR